VREAKHPHTAHQCNRIWWRPNSPTNPTRINARQEHSLKKLRAKKTRLPSLSILNIKGNDTARLA
jgi:hypothetical protein